MFCPNCGTSLSENEDFCPNCGKNIKVIREQQNMNLQSSETVNEQLVNNVQSQQYVYEQSNAGSTMTEVLSPKSNNFIKSLISKVKTFIIKYKKQELISLICIGVLVVLLIVYNIIFGFESLKWNEDYEAISLDYITQANIKLGIKFSDSEKIKDIKYSSTCGEVLQQELEFSWDLTDALGKCEIIIQHKHKKIKKEFTVISFNGEQDELFLNSDIDVDSDEDLDLDGLTNKQEKEYKTNPEIADSDMDGLDDNYELFTSKTNPNKKDTDGDGIEDGAEVDLGLDPLKEDSKGDGIKDSERELTYNVNNEKLGIDVLITGKGNISNVAINSFKNETFTSMNGLLDTIYNFYTAGKISNATVKIKYNLEEIQTQGLNEDNLTLYYFNDETKELEKVPTTVDKENKVLTVNLNHFSKYVIGDSDVVLTNSNSDILFVIDNSVSMYSESQMIAAGYNNSRGAIGNDITFKRITLTNKMIDMLTGNYKFAVSEFSGNYVKLNDFTSSTDAVKEAADSMKSHWSSNPNGTNIISALNSGISEFKKDNDSHYLILLTDGKNTTGSLSSSKTSIINSAKSKNVKICVIGLGSSIDTDDLNEVAESTGCDYYNANNSAALDEIYSIVGADIYYNQVDTDGDGKANGTIVADSGFIVTRDGFSFKNYGTNLSKGGHCYGMATFAELYYTKKLPMSVSMKTVKKSGLFGTEYVSSYPYNLNNTYFAKYDNLYDYTLKSNVLKYGFGYEAFGEDTPIDFRVLDKDLLAINSKYKEEINDTELYDIIESKSTLGKEAQLEKYGVNYINSENILLNEDKMQTSKAIDNSDKQLLNAIYTGFIRQDVMTNYSSASDFWLFLRNIMGYESTDKINSAGFIYLLTKRLNDGDVPVIFSSYTGSLHAINAISLVQDNVNANHYYIGVYDNNFPGEKRYVDIECTKKTCVTVANSYYTNSDQPIRISLSLDADLEFYDDGKFYERN